MSLAFKLARYRAAGDPGLLGSLWSGVKSVAGVAKAIPGPIGWAATAVNKLAGSKATTSQPQNLAGTPNSMPGVGVPQQPTPGLVGIAQRLVPGGQSGYQAVPSTSVAGAAPRGYHVNKTSYFLKDGTFVPAESRWVRNRHRNPLNPRAASKAITRIESLKRATSRFSRISIKKKCSR